jgi:di/tricarboxylate transporter
MNLSADLEFYLSLVLLFAALLAFVWEKIRMETTAMILFGSILFISAFNLPNWPHFTDIMIVFSNEAPLTIVAMFAIGAALNKHRVIEQLTSFLRRLTTFSYKPFMLILLCSVALLSAFVNNTPVVVILLPVAISLSKTLKVSSSKMLIPISYASIFGGCCTLVGTSTNILASGFMTDSEYYPQMRAMAMFELSKVGLPLMIMGIIFLVLFGRNLLPKREALSKIISEIRQKEFLTEALITPESVLVGSKISAPEITSLKGVRVLDIVRRGINLAHQKMDLQDLELEPGDRMILSCRPSGIVDAGSLEGVNIIDDHNLGLEQISMGEAVMVEGMVGPSSVFSGKTLEETDFRSKFNLTILAIHRKGKNLGLSMRNVRLRPGDTLLLLGPDFSIEKLRRTEEIVLLDESTVDYKNIRIRTGFVVSTLIGVITFATLGILPISISAILGLILLLGTGCISLKDCAKSVEWNLLILIYAMLSLGICMQHSGASVWVADLIQSLCVSSFDENWRLIGALIYIYLFTAILTELLSNNATIAIMAPVTLAVAFQLGLDQEAARGFVLTACIASSASFITPIGYQTNTFVYSVGGYRFKDFVKFGVYPMLIYFTGTILLVSWYWKLFPY